MTREDAYKTLTEMIKNPNLIKHHLACEAVMKTLAKRFTGLNTQTTINVDQWGIVGLLHDADYELTRDNPKNHTLVLQNKIKFYVEPEVMYAIKSHNWPNVNAQPKNLMDWSLYCCDELTGLIIAGALVHPDKKLASLTTEFILNRFKEKSFAKGADREHVQLCEKKLGITLTEFIDLALKAMQGINIQLGL